MATVVPPETRPENRARSMSLEQAKQATEAEQYAERKQAALWGPAAGWTRGMPVRYALVALGSALLMIGIPLSVPMGPAQSTAWREL